MPLIKLKTNITAQGQQVLPRREILSKKKSQKIYQVSRLSEIPLKKYMKNPKTPKELKLTPKTPEETSC